MTLTSFILGLFAVAKAVPIVYDALMAAISLFYQQEIERAKGERLEAIKELKDAKNPTETQAALGKLVRARAK